MSAGAASQACVVIPGYNAAQTIAPLVHQVRQLGLDVVVVNDGSTDQTARLAMEAGATVISHLHNRGKGLALRTGFAFALQGAYASIVTLDGDGQHDPSEIPTLLAALDGASVEPSGPSQDSTSGRRPERPRLWQGSRGIGVVVGHRLASPETMPPIRRITNQLMSLVVSWLTRQSIPDSQCGFRAIRRTMLEGIGLSARRFELETELLLAAARGGWSIASIPVRSIYHAHRSYIHPLLDGVRFVRVILRFQVGRMFARFSR